MVAELGARCENAHTMMTMLARVSAVGIDLLIALALAGPAHAQQAVLCDELVELYPDSGSDRGSGRLRVDTPRGDLAGLLHDVHDLQMTGQARPEAHAHDAP